MRLLVLGGGGFLGFHVVAAALSQGHDVTVLSRGGRCAVDSVEVLLGDRRGDLTALRGRSWDAVLDTFTDAEAGCPAVTATAELLRGRVEVYGYVSGMSVYAPTGPDVPDETAPVRAAGRESDRLQERSLAKLAGEDAVRRRYGDRAFLPRVGIMVGPRSTRFTYWPLRLAGALDGTLREMLDACARAAGPASLADLDVVTGPEHLLRRTLTGIDEEERPLWFPEDQIPQLAIDSGRAAAAGLEFGSPDVLAADTLAWAREDGEPALTDGAFAAVEAQMVQRVRPVR